MNTRKKLLRAASYAAAPRLAFALDSPKKAAVAKAGAWATEQVTRRVLPQRRRQPSVGMLAAKGLGAAAIAVPLGWWLGRKLQGPAEGRGR